MINEVKELVDYIIRKKKIGGNLTPLDYNKLIPTAQINVINKYVKRNGIEAMSYNADKISPLKVTATQSVTAGSFTKPADMLYVIGLTYNYSKISEETDEVISVTRKDVDLVREMEYNKRINSYIVKPDGEFPIAKWTSTGFDVYPTNLNEVKVTYIKEPDTPDWAYTLSSGRAVYNAGASTDFTLPLSCLYELAMEVLSMVGINIREADITNYAEKEGNE